MKQKTIFKMKQQMLNNRSKTGVNTPMPVLEIPINSINNTREKEIWNKYPSKMKY
ncbi:MAG: hypothetical protein GY757_57730 [bacterium]|nr:hypothetical protein [bacterium]